MSISTWCVSALLVSSIVVIPPSPVATSETKPLAVWGGADSRVTKTGYFRAGDKIQWRKVWMAHLGKTDADAFDVLLPHVEIDFAKCMVIAIFRGEAANHRGVVVESIDETADAVRVRFSYLTYQSDVALDAGAAAAPPPPRTAYGFILLPASNKQVVLEENVQHLKDHPAVWKERARLAPGK